jgi:hypothetical protein
MPSSPISPCPSCPPYAARGHGCTVYWSSVTDAQWAILEPLLPAPAARQTAAEDPRSIAAVRWWTPSCTSRAVVSRGGTCRWSSRQPRRCTRVRPLGPRRGVAAHPRRAARPSAGAGRAGPVPHRGDHRLADGARRHRAPIQPWLGWRARERTASSGTSPWM